MRTVLFISTAVFVSVIFSGPATSQGRHPRASLSRIDLGENDWHIQSSALIPDRGEAVSTSNFATSGWHAARVPTTVIAALVKNGTLPDPYFGMNFRSIPGTTY